MNRTDDSLSEDNSSYEEVTNLISYEENNLDSLAAGTVDFELFEEVSCKRLLTYS